MLSLKGITKNYVTGDETVKALKGIDIEFRENEFVSILGQSGCGKTTMLNIIGGLDRYTDGDLIINGRSTKEFKDSDWDVYRNHSIGFVFQSYNLIPHQTVLSNVELALTLSGVSKEERRERALKVLKQVGLEDQINKKPNQMSGGQMQRVAIARALINDPDILLADEPTGALDSQTSIQIMEILKDIAKEKLIIMVTHNPEIAEKYSTRIINLLDGVVTNDSNPYSANVIEPIKDTKADKKQKYKKTSMSFFTALSLSLNNLMTKKGRTILTAFAGSIGIIGIALILSLSNGVQNYIDQVQEDTLSSYPIQIENQTFDLTEMLQSMQGEVKDVENRTKDKIYSTGIMYNIVNTLMSQVITNNLTDFKTFLDDPSNGFDSLTTSIKYTYQTPLNIYRADFDNGLIKTNPSTIIDDLYKSMGVSYNVEGPVSSMMNLGMSSNNIWTELIDNEQMLKNQYDVVSGRWPEKYNEVVLIIDENNGIQDYALYALGLKDAEEIKDMLKKALAGEVVEKQKAEKETYTYEQMMNLKFKLLVNSDYFEKQANGTWEDKSGDDAYVVTKLKDSEDISIVGILRPSPDAVTTSVRGGSIGYRSDLMTHLINKVNDSEVVKQQKADPKVDIFTGLPFESKDVNEQLYDAYIAAIKDPEQKAKVQAYVDQQKKEGKPLDITEEMLQAYAQTLPANQQQTVQAYLAQLKESGLSPNDIVKRFSSQMNFLKTDATYDDNLLKLGVSDLSVPYRINIYPKDFESKEKITEKIENYNNSVAEGDKITYTDYIGLLMSSVSTIINAISYILIAFVSISLIVSSIMIGIITYISVLERTKEIGILRSIGASKRDISRVFNAETLIVGFAAGAIGIIVTLLLNIPINIIIHNITDISGLSKLPWLGALALVGISMLLTFIAGLIPSKIAAKKDPVIALRTE
ncbi:MAG: ABC transporter ATP-binding protein/permease [Ruminococcus sp.]|nr:ABC transporter ATP-binding protein/permease [Ruminococcus sp.]